MNLIQKNNQQKHIKNRKKIEKLEQKKTKLEKPKRTVQKVKKEIKQNESENKKYKFYENNISKMFKSKTTKTVEKRFKKISTT
jgi:hypothetical protein